MEYRSALKIELRWNITCPLFLNVWENPWIPSIIGFRITSARPPNSPIIYISDLINPVSKTWDAHLLHACFSPQRYREILKIPLGEKAREDRRVSFH